MFAPQVEFTFPRPHVDRKQLPPIGVDEEFPQHAQWMNKKGVFQLLSRVNAPLDWAWNSDRKWEQSWGFSLHKEIKHESTQRFKIPLYYQEEPH